jgi:hypothetical protein
MRRWSALPRPFLATLAGVLALVAILYGSLWMYAVRYPGPVVELGFNHVHDPHYDEERIRSWLMTWWKEVLRSKLDCTLATA